LEGKALVVPLLTEQDPETLQKIDCCKKNIGRKALVVPLLTEQDYETLLKIYCRLKLTGRKGSCSTSFNGTGL
jgi:uncharacterized protein YifN (PemK superfamily)